MAYHTYRVSYVFITLFIYCTHAQDPYASQPKLFAEDGNLKLQAGKDKNISFLTSGSGGVYLNEENLVTLSRLARSASDNVDSFKLSILPHLQNDVYRLVQSVEGKDGLTKRLMRLELTNTSVVASPSGRSNLNQRVQRLDRQMRKLQADLRRNECASNPCRNGGTCIDLFAKYQCICPENWEGVSCEIDVNECVKIASTEDRCQNGGTCINTPGGFHCVCPPHYFGLHCAAKNFSCSAASDRELCGHGTCREQAGSYVCVCDEGWTNGERGSCDKDIDECASKVPVCSLAPPVQCINTPGSFKCGPCAPGYTGNGLYCVDIDECLVNNGGCSMTPYVECTNTLGYRRCGPCPPGWVGDDGTSCRQGVTGCAINNGGCHPLATCTEVSDSVRSRIQCTCQPGMGGTGVGLMGCDYGRITDPCATSPCGVGGSCLRMGDGQYVCVCRPGSTGKNCEQSLTSSGVSCNPNPCQNGGLCHVTPSLGMSCVCRDGYTGAWCAEQTLSCGGTIVQLNGTIRNSANTYSTGTVVSCVWTLDSGDEGSILKLNFSSMFRVYSKRGDCIDNHLEIRDGDLPYDSSSVLGRFCSPSSTPSTLTSFSSKVIVTYLVTSRDPLGPSDQWELSWTSAPPECGSVLANISGPGVLTSPGFPRSITKSGHCLWYLSANPGYRLEFTVTEISLGNQQGSAGEPCDQDYLKIHDGEMAYSPVLLEVCQGSRNLPPVTTSGTHSLIWFSSDAASKNKGFQIMYRPIPGIPGCGGTFTSPEGDIHTKYLAELNQDLLCEWNIHLSVQEKIRLVFNRMDIDSPNCDSYLEVYNAHSKSLVAKFCDGASSRAPLLSDGNSVRLVYKVKYQPSKVKPGFSLHYETVCGGQFTSPQGVLKSPFFPRAYPSSRVCRYTIVQPPGKLIKLDFLDFDLSDPEPKDKSCVETSVKVFNGDSRNHSLLGEYCGPKEPSTIVSTRNIVYLEFKTDGSSDHIGFRANYSTLDVECGGIFTAPAGSISLDTSLRWTSSCEWILSAPEGNTFHLTFVQFNIESGYSSFSRLGNQQCSQTDLTLYDNVTNPGTLMNKLCGASLPSPMTSLSNLVTLILSLSKSSLQANPVASFVVNYVRVNATTMCGGSYFAPSGVLSTPLYPSPYPSSRQCVWVISVPMGQQIRLNFSSFGLEPSNFPSCVYVDYLEIRDGGYESSPLRGKYCGTDYPREFVSSGHQLYLKFVSDQDRNKWPGFQLLWDSASTACGGVLTGPSGSITSPNYPYPYGYSGMCYWKILVSQGSTVTINFVDVNINCMSIFSGNLEVFDGDNSFAPLLRRYCRGESKWEPIIQSNSHMVLVRYQSLNNDDKGFHLQYQTACNRTFTGYRGSIETINYPGNYPPKTECWWNITVPIGNQISLAFSDFTLEKRTRNFLVRGFGNGRGSPSLHGFRYDLLEDVEKEHSQRIRAGRCFDYLEMFETYAEDESFMGTFFDSVSYRTADRGNNIHPLLNKTCGQEQPPAVLTTNGSAVYIHFVTDFGMNAKGFRLEWSLKGCGGIFEGRSYGHITSPHYGEHGAGKYYKHNLVCDWIIRGGLDHSVEITITTVDLETRSDCNLDHLIVYSGSNREGVNLTQPLCMNPSSPIVVTAPNEAFVHFESDLSLSGRGFELTFQLKPAICGGIFTGSNGVIHSRNYPKNYGQGDKCVYEIKVPEGHLIQFTLEDLDLGVCWPKTFSPLGRTIIQVYNGDSVSAPLLTSYCGNQFTANTSTVTSSSNKLTVLFQAGAHATPKKGFKASYKLACGDRIETDGSGNFKVSLSNLIASKLTKCSWTIVAKKPESRITLTVPTTRGFQIYTRDQFSPYDDSSATNEFFVYDGETDKGVPLVERPLDRIPHSIVSRGPAMHVVLTFSENYLDSLLDEVFFASYSVRNIACGGELSGDEGSFSSPNYPMQYPINADCVWTVKSSPGNKIAIQFTDFQLEKSDFCNEDFVELRESNVQGKLLGVYCANQIPGNVTVNSNFWIRFRSSATGAAPGFTADFSYVNNIEILGESRGVITSPQYPALYTYVKKFSWYIRVNQESRIRIKMIDFWFESGGQGCSSFGNSLNIYEGNLAEDAKLLHSDLCTAAVNIPITSLTNEVLLQFDSNPSRRGSHFKLEWEAISGEDLKSTESDVQNSTSWNPFPYLQNASLSSYSLTLNNSSLNISHQYRDKPEFVSILKPELMTAVTRIIAPVGYRVTIQVTANSPLNRVQVYSGSSDPFRQGDLIKLTELVPPPLPDLFTPVVANTSKSALITSPNNVVYLVVETSATKMFFNYDKLDTTTNATVMLSCGGIITGLTSGSIQMNKLIGTRTRFPRTKVGYKEILTCDWLIAVRPRRTIQIQMTGSDFNPKTGSEKDCNEDNYIMIRNGGSNISPKLGQDEKFCSSITPENERKQPKLTSSGNLVFVRYKANINAIQSFSLSFAELTIGCGGDITLREAPLGSTWALLSSPHYPEVPPPHVECTWNIRGPPHRKLRLTFDTDSFDLAYSNGCTTEYVEVLDGQTVVSPSLGKFCAVSPSVVESSGNTLLVKYFTDIDEPKSGFSANVSLQTCGGVYKDISWSHTLSISYRDLIKSESCEWTLQTRQTQTLSLNLTKFDVNEPLTVWHMNKMTNCSAEFGRLSIYTVEPFSKNQSLVYSECSSATVPFSLETGVSQIIVQFKWGNKTPDRSGTGLGSIAQTRDLSNRGFSLTLKTKQSSCGGILTGRSGTLSLPSLPRPQHRYCLWNIRVPKGQRIKVKPTEVDFAGKMPGYVWSTDDVFLYNNAIYFGYPYKVSQATRPFALMSKSDVKVIESTDNKLDVYTVSVTGKGIKLEYTSEDPAICGGTLDSPSGSIQSPSKLNSFSCEWSMTTPPYQTTALIVNGTVSKDGTYGCKTGLVSLDNSLVAYNHLNQIIHRFCATYHKPTLFLNPYSTLSLLALKGHLKVNNELLSPPMDFNISYTTYPCGGVFKSPSNITLTPSNNSSGSGELHCVWLVEYPAGDEIKIPSPSLPCIGDTSLSIYNGPRPSSPLLTRLNACQAASPVTSTSNILWIEFTSPGTNLGFSLALEKVSLACGDILSGTTGVISSPGYTDQGYPDNTECEWYIQVLSGFHISLQFESKFFIQDSVNCTADYLLIYDWFGDDYVLIDRICGRSTTGRSYNSTRNQMKLVFRSDGGVNGDGFKIRYWAKCGGTYTLPILGHAPHMTGPIEGTISSPNYPANYPPMVKCNYTFIDELRLIRLNFTDFQLEPGPDCEFDNLTLMSANSDHNTHLMFGFSYVMMDMASDTVSISKSKVYCGDTGPGVQTFTDRVSVIFHSDPFKAGRGFEFQYQLFKCGGEVTTEGIISTPGYKSDMICVWNITAPPNKMILITILSYKTSPYPHWVSSDDDDNEETTCDYGIFITDPGNPTKNISQQTKTICDSGGDITENNPFTFRSTGRNSFLKLRNSHVPRDEGLPVLKFKVRFNYDMTMGCGGPRYISANSSLHITQLKDAPDSHSCSWDLTTLPGYTVKISFPVINIYSPVCGGAGGDTPDEVKAVINSQCLCNRLEVIMIDTPPTVLCLSNQSVPLLSVDHSVTSLKYVQNSYFPGLSFDILVESTLPECGDRIINATSTGRVFVSPPYRRNLNCQWKLSVDGNNSKVVQIKFLDMDIEPGTGARCEDNYLQLRNPGGSVLGKYCGGTQPPVSYLLFDTNSNKPTIEFRTGDKMPTPRRGFKFEYQVLGCSRNYSEDQHLGNLVSMMPPPGGECRIQVSAPSKNHTLDLVFLDFQLSSENCNTDKLVLKDAEGGALATLCGTALPSPLFTSTYSLSAHLYSSRTTPRFRVSFTYLTSQCGVVLTDSRGALASRDYPLPYRKPRSCVYTITPPQPIKVTFVTFDLGNAKCASNYLRVDVAGQNTVKYCAGEKPADIDVTASVILTYTTSTNNEGQGWLLTYTDGL
uniref:Cubilin n=3 Tax=Cacopsylla melanoneura TaxID=428564 RepID=A0A8D8U6L7_9HEMI